MTSAPSRRIALVLGGGGARGLAHLGVLSVLEERGYEIEAIAGCSIGGIVGAMIGSGHTSAEIVDLVASTRFQDVFDFGEMGGLVGGKGIDRLLRAQVRERFEDLTIPLKVTAVDVQRGSLVILGSGPLSPALRASGALPGILSPVEHLDRVLIDGGLLNSLPIDVVRTMSLAPVVAVDVAAPPDRPLDFDAGGILETIKRFGKRDFRSLTVELFMKSYDIPQRLITQTRLAMDPPEVLIRPDLDRDFGVEDVHLLDEAVALGRDAAVAALDAFESSGPAP
jgi:NTE family protein